MLTNIIRALRCTDEKLQNLLADLAADYARELLTAHGLVEIEIDHIQRTSKAKPAVVPIDSEKINLSIPYNETARTRTDLDVFRVETTVNPTIKVDTFQIPTPNCASWSGPEVVAALSVAAAAIVALLFCLAAIFKS